VAVGARVAGQIGNPLVPMELALGERVLVASEGFSKCGHNGWAKTEGTLPGWGGARQMQVWWGRLDMAEVVVTLSGVLMLRRLRCDPFGIGALFVGEPVVSLAQPPAGCLEPFGFKMRDRPMRLRRPLKAVTSHSTPWDEGGRRKDEDGRGWRLRRALVCAFWSDVVERMGARGCSGLETHRSAPIVPPGCRSTCIPKALRLTL
jgi:hypothetical protein